MPNNNKISVDLKPNKYDVIIGADLYARAAQYITPLLARNRLIIIADENAWAVHGERFSASLRAAQIEIFVVRVASGETSKSFASFERVIEEILAHGVERTDIIVAFGGGVIGDLTGFAAGVINRGIGFIQVPTTLLSQVDSSVGGKTAINAKAGKNLVGIFHQPRLVLADTTSLETLGSRDIMAGFAEIFKIGLINDAAFFEYCQTNAKQIIGANGSERQYAIEKAIAAKARIVIEDEFEHGIRATLNLGHSFAHALEAATNYDETALRHGEAVAIGIGLAAKFSAKLGILEARTAQAIISFIDDCGYYQQIAEAFSKIAEAKQNFAPEKLLETMCHDKKNSGGQINLILLKSIGNAYVHKNAPKQILLEFLRTECENRFSPQYN